MKNTERKSRGEIYLDFLTNFMEKKILDRDGNYPDETELMIAAGIVLAFDNARKQTGIINEELLCRTCERFLGDKWLVTICASC